MTGGEPSLPAPSPRPGAGATAAVALLAAGLALLALGAGPGWLEGPVGGGDAWQNLWNLDHVGRVLRGEAQLWSSDRVWAPEGASLRAHTLAPTLSLPGALLARAVTPVAAYNLLVVLTFVLAAAATFRLARRLGIAPAGAVIAGLVLAFHPTRTARAFGHLNLLALGLLPLALEALVVAARRSGWRAWAAAGGAGAALAALAFADWYLAVLGALTATAFAAFELARARGRRRAVALRLGAAGALALALVAPAAGAFAAGPAVRGHDPRLCCTAVTSLAVPNRVQRIAAWTRPLTERNTQNVAEGAAYLGLVPLAATAWLLASPRRRPRDLDWALAAGAVALLLALGPAPRVFDRWLELPLPYRWLEGALPVLGAGGCVSRFVQLAALPLALACGWAAVRLAGRGPRGRLAAAAAAAVLAVEYAPVAPPVPPWPHDPAMAALAAAPEEGAVLDLGLDTGALVRQLEHGRAQTLGYLSRRPEPQWTRRRLDPVLEPLLGEGEVAAAPPLATASAWLRHRWGVHWVVAAPGSSELARAEAMGLAAAWGSELSAVLPVAPLPLAPLTEVELGRPTAALARDGVVVEGGFEPETVGSAAGAVRGRWIGARARLLAPLAPGRWRLSAVAPRPGAPRLALTAGGRRTAAVVRGAGGVDFSVAAADLGPGGALLLELEASPFRPVDDPRELGVLLVALRRLPDPATR